MQEIDGETYISVEEASALLGVKRATLYAYVSRGVLRSYRQSVGRQRLYRLADVEALLTVRADTPSPAARPASADDDRTLRDVDLPDAESWAGDH
jgi:excisionase family DNA binding protein